MVFAPRSHHGETRPLGQSRSSSESEWAPRGRPVRQAGGGWRRNACSDRGSAGQITALDQRDDRGKVTSCLTHERTLFVVEQTDITQLSDSHDQSKQMESESWENLCLIKQTAITHASTDIGRAITRLRKIATNSPHRTAHPSQSQKITIK